MENNLTKAIFSMGDTCHSIIVELLRAKEVVVLVTDLLVCFFYVFLCFFFASSFVNETLDL